MFDLPPLSNGQPGSVGQKAGLLLNGQMRLNLGEVDHSGNHCESRDGLESHCWSSRESPGVSFRPFTGATRREAPGAGQGLEHTGWHLIDGVATAFNYELPLE